MKVLTRQDISASIFFPLSLSNNTECFKGLILFRQSLTLILHLDGKRLTWEYCIPANLEGVKKYLQRTFKVIE